MRMYNKYIVSLVITGGVINITLACFGQEDLILYFTLNVIAFLVLTLLYVYFNPRARGALSIIGAVFFAAFAVTVALKVVEILAVK